MSMTHLPNHADLADRVSRELLPYVNQPAQYLGGEVNQLAQPGQWAAADVRVAIAFPDTYAVGMSHLGCQILYWICNHIPGVCAERVFCPWIDAEQRMRDKGIGLFTWDTRQPVADADILAVSLQYELAYTNVLTLLDLAGIPLRAGDRDDRHPLVLAGGPQADNPEPLADFLDLVVIGDGEPSIQELLTAYLELKRAGVRRRDRIAHLARRFRWLYAPSLYEISYNSDGTIGSKRPRLDGIATVIERCLVADFENAPVPARPIVPYAEAVHERVSIEIMRGCPRRCRFCHAGHTKGRVRRRSVERILEIAEQAWSATGYTELGLLSLSTADYPELPELVERLNERFAPRCVSISVPSLRVDRRLQQIPAMVNVVRKGGLTIAVEAAREDMRAAIGKEISDADLMDGVEAAFRAGWRSVKLYFIYGFPFERQGDLVGIYELSRRIAQARRRLCGRPAQVNVTVSWFVPKPHTPLQWAPQAAPAYLREARRKLLALAGKRGSVHLRPHNVDRSVLEAVFARGDRRLGPVLTTAYKLGARFDAWDETFNPQIWQRAFEQCGIDPAWYAQRARSTDEILPWDHIAGGLTHERLREQYEDFCQRLRRRTEDNCAPGPTA